jgi:peptide subunit release factor 1 (eRF1)
MAWTWRYEDAEGKAVEGPSEAFSSQSDAESWLGQTWRDLLAAGAVRAVLVEEDRVEYQMSLLPPGQ